MILVEPQCLLRHLLRAASADRGLRAKRSDACLVLAQFLAETPPRVWITAMFFKNACDAGVAEGCEQWKALSGEPKPCDDDSYECGFDDWRSRDLARQDKACMRGFGEVCLLLAWTTTDDDDLRRDYYELACQHEARGGCAILGKLLAPECEDDEADSHMKCLPTDAEAAAQAGALACEAGMADSCW